jgi:hypothetical protein
VRGVKPRWFFALVWMLALALPLQGLAAASRLMCHHAQMPAAVAEAAPCHGETSADPQAAPAAHAGCIACAACHGMAALPSSLPVILPGLPAQPPAAAAAPLVLPFITAGPERPPRTLRA